MIQSGSLVSLFTGGFSSRLGFNSDSPPYPTRILGLTACARILLNVAPTPPHTTPRCGRGRDGRAMPYPLRLRYDHGYADAHQRTDHATAFAVYPFSLRFARRTAGDCARVCCRRHTPAHALPRTRRSAPDIRLLLGPQFQFWTFTVPPPPTPLHTLPVHVTPSPATHVD